MITENGTWTLYGMSKKNPDCIHTMDKACAYIKKVGFLPLFQNDIPGFSLEERTAPETWWSGNPAEDPWEWREIITRNREIAYGKFFDKKAGFISADWLPYFVNYRRDGYDFDALWDDEKATRREKKIMDLFGGENADLEYFSYEIKQNAGFCKGGEKGFEGILTDLQMKTYLVPCDFRQKKNKKGQAYGWSIAVCSTPEHIFGRELVTSAYSEGADDSGRRIAAHLQSMFPKITDRQIHSILKTPAGRIG